MFASYPWFRDFGAIAQLNGLARNISLSLSRFHFDFWFIDSYQNIDGVQMGWPGLMTLLYYGYNLGLFFPVVVIIQFFIKKRTYTSIKENWLFAVAFFLFLLVAEVFPRIGLAYLPDRAWLFVSLILCFLLPKVIVSTFEDMRLKVAKTWIVALIVLSSLLSWSITYTKQGWTTGNEYEAAIFVKDKTPKNSVLITQSGNYAMVKYFADRKKSTPDPSFFLDADKISSIEIEDVAKQSDSLTPDQTTNLKNQDNELLNKLQPIFDASAIGAFEVARDKIDVNHEISLYLEEKLSYLNQIAQSELDSSPIYILYSGDKFTGLYGSRQWWRDSNAYGADISKFDQNPLLKKVYDIGNIKIWLYEKKS